MALSDLLSRVVRAMSSAPKTLEDLSALSSDQLSALYKKAKTPKVEDLEGQLIGRMLAVPPASAVPGLSGLLKRVANSKLFPWQGKNFRTLGKGRGEGINRVLGDRREWFRFETFVAKSNGGDFDAVHLNYDSPGNPAFVRRIKDEVREVSPGLWLGLANVKTGSSHILALYFALARR